MPTELVNEPEVPDCCEHLWVIFNRLCNSRTYGMGENPITYGDIQAYCVLTKTHLQPFEVDLLVSMDNAFRSVKIDKTDGKS